MVGIALQDLSIQLAMTRDDSGHILPILPSFVRANQGVLKTDKRMTRGDDISSNSLHM